MRTAWAAAVRRRPLFYGALALLAALSPLQDFLGPPDPPAPAEGELSVSGVLVSDAVVLDRRFGAPSVTFTLAAKRLWKEAGKGDGAEFRARVKAVCLAPSYALRAGDRVILTGRLALPRGRRNPGGFDERAYLRRRGVTHVFYSPGEPKLVARDEGNFLNVAASRAREALRSALYDTFERREASLLAALLWGDRAGMDEAVERTFTATGTLHILSVSGFNVGFVAFFALLFGRALPLAARRALAAAAVWAYAWLVGWQAPVARAACMATVFLAAPIAGRRADAWNALGLAALVILAVNPLEAGDPGFQLSFAAVAGILAFMKEPLAGPRALRALGALFWVSVAAFFATAPVLAAWFHVLAPWGVVANFAAVPAAFVLFTAGFSYLSFAAALPDAAAFFEKPVRAVTEVLLSSLGFLESLPGASLVTGAFPFWLLLLFSAATAAAFFVPGRVRKTLALSAVLAVAVAARAALPAASSAFEITVLDVGQGDAIYVETPDGARFLVDAGTEAAARRHVVPFLRWKGARSLDGVVVTHDHADHAGGLGVLAESVRIRAVARDAASAEALFHGHAQARALNPKRGFVPSDANDGSIVLRVESLGLSALLAADAGPDAVERLSWDPAVRADFLKVPHHGADAGAAWPAFLGAVRPSIAAVSVGEANGFGHPRQATLAELSRRGIRTLRTDYHGAVTLRRVRDGETALDFESLL